MKIQFTKLYLSQNLIMKFKEYKNKIYFVIDQQMARHFVQYSECLSKTLPNYATQIINPLLN